MSMKTFIKKILLKLGINIEHAISSENIRNFVTRFRDNYKSVKLIRVGGDGDGGYLIPDILKTVKYCFSPGVGNIIKFEAELSKAYGIKSFMLDGSINCPSFNDDNLKFEKKFLGSRNDENFITLSSWINKCISKNSENRILQMDIEGGEYDVLIYESAEDLSQFSCMIIEFHDLQNVCQRRFIQMISAIFEKIYLNFSIVHVHPNNVSGIVNLGGIEIPSSIEVTFMKNDLISAHTLNSAIFLPNPLDSRVSNKIPDVKMPEIWWKK
jgi:hypothetical protein